MVKAKTSSIIYVKISTCPASNTVHQGIRCTDLEPVIVKACHCSVGTDLSVS